MPAWEKDRRFPMIRFVTDIVRFTQPSPATLSILIRSEHEEDSHCSTGGYQVHHGHLYWHLRGPGHVPFASSVYAFIF